MKQSSFYIAIGMIAILVGIKYHINNTNSKPDDFEDQGIPEYSVEDVSIIQAADSTYDIICEDSTYTGVSEIELHSILQSIK